ncbi:unnamed protein product [Leuciscus chuanchicus]
MEILTRPVQMFSVMKIISSSSISGNIFNCTVHGVSAAERDEVKRKSVKEGESVTLDSGVIKSTNDVMTWYFNEILIAEITGDQSKICTDDQCKERFRDRLKLDHQTGSLIITNTRNTDSGEYKLQIIINNSRFSITRVKRFSVSVIGVFGVGSDKVSVSVMEGDSVTLYTGVETKQQEDIKWYFNDTRIAQISGDQNKICTDVQCNEDTKRFRDRLKLDHQTGSLTITNIRNTDSGEYKLLIISSRNIEKIFKVTVHGVSASELYEVNKQEGESVTLDSGEIRKPSDGMTWYFNDTLIAEFSGDQNKTCTDVQCEDSDGRFRDRLKLDHQTGSLTITNTRNTDCGEYKLQININNSSFSITRVKRFNLTVIDSCLSSGVVAGICVGVVILVAVAVTAVLVEQSKEYNKTKQDDVDNPDGTEDP